MVLPANTDCPVFLRATQLSKRVVSAPLPDALVPLGFQKFVFGEGSRKNETAEVVQFDDGAFNRRMFIGLLECTQ
jgi:hypothetical protein